MARGHALLELLQVRVAPGWRACGLEELVAKAVIYCVYWSNRNNRHSASTRITPSQRTPPEKGTPRGGEDLKQNTTKQDWGRGAEEEQTAAGRRRRGRQRV